MYRAVANLKTGKGSISRGQAFPRRAMSDAIARQLFDGGKIVEVSAPPLAELPFMAGYLDNLRASGIDMADVFVDADPAMLAGLLGIEEERVQALQTAICRSMDSPQPNG